MKTIDINKYTHICRGQKKDLPKTPYVRFTRTNMSVIGYKPTGERCCAVYYLEGKELLIAFGVGRRKYQYFGNGIMLNSKKIVCHAKPGLYPFEVSETNIEDKTCACVVIDLENPIKLDLPDAKRAQSERSGAEQSSFEPGLRDIVQEFVGTMEPGKLYFARHFAEFCSKKMRSEVTPGMIKDILSGGDFGLDGNAKTGFKNRN